MSHLDASRKQETDSDTVDLKDANPRQETVDLEPNNSEDDPNVSKYHRYYIIMYFCHSPSNTPPNAPLIISIHIS